MHLISAFLGVSSVRDLGQTVVDGLVLGGRYAIIGVALALVLGTTGRFHFAFATTFTVAAYVTSVVTGAGTSWVLAALVGLGACAILGVVIEAGIYRPIELRSRGDATLAVFVAALGATIVGENAIRLIWSSNSRSLAGVPDDPVNILGLQTTSLDLTIIGVAVVIGVLVSAMLGRTSLGRQIKAVRVNPEMAMTVGVRSRRVILIVFAIASAIGGVGAVLDAMKFAVLPNMGTQPLLFGMVVAFLAGTRAHPMTVVLAGFLLGLVQSLSTIWLSQQVSIVAVFAVLILFLSYRSLTLALARYSESPWQALRRALNGSAPAPRAKRA